jgi:hypothetical protein
MCTPFCTTPYKLIQKSGNQRVVQSPEGVQYKRNSTHVRKYNEPKNHTEIDNQIPEMEGKLNETPIPATDTSDLEISSINSSSLTLHKFSLQQSLYISLVF